MLFKKLTKKITAGITVAALGFSLTFSAPAVVEASNNNAAVSIAGTIIAATMQYNQLNKEMKALDETEEGRTQLYDHYKKELGVNNDPTLNARLDKIMSNLTRAVGKVDPAVYDKPYKYFISNKEELNAACSVGHVMIVNTGVFNLLTTDDEIAAIVGHEMGHGQKDHVIKGQKKQLNKMVIAQLGATAAGGGTLASVVASVTANNSIAHGNRKYETEADDMAWEYILHSDYNIGACAAAMQKISELYGEKYNTNILNPASHPDSGKRRDNYANKLYEYSGKHVSAKDGVITINGKTFTTVAATNSMSSAERSYFVLGNLAKAYHNGKTSSAATVSNGTIYLGDMAIMTPANGDEDAYILSERLNELINTPNTADKKKADKDKKKSDKDKKKADKNKK